MKTMKQILAGFLVVAMLVTGLMITPIDAKAAESVDGENGVIYVLDEENYDFNTLWKTKTAPTKAGYVFGGWYTKGEDNAFTAIKESEGNTYTEAYAKFVPAEVLSVRAQLQATTEEANGNVDSTYLRLLSGVNGLDYQKVGFDIKYNKTIQEESSVATNITKAYESITNSETDSKEIKANAVFGDAATHFSVLRLDEIEKVNFDFVIYVTPQWTTLDGTLVEGQAKYVRVKDGYADHQYISVPVNFLEGSKVAAGQMELHYDSDAVELVDFEAGVLMPEMAYRDDKNGVVKIVGNIDGTSNVEPETEIYANVWFKAKGTGNSYDFTMEKMSFCNWELSTVNDLTAWDVVYLK